MLKIFMIVDMLFVKRSAIVLCAFWGASCIAQPVNSPPTNSSTAPASVELRAIGVPPKGLIPSPVAATNTEADYKIGAQDLIDVQVWGQTDLARTVRVNVQGKISLPLLGPLDVLGLTAQQVERLIADRLSEKYLQDPQVTVFIKEFTTLRFTVEGAVNKPGVYPLVGQMTLLRALAVAGGQGQLSDMGQVMLFRLSGDGQRSNITIDAEKIRTGEVADPLLQNDDLVVVNRSKTRIALKDSVFRDVWDIINPFSILRGF